MQVFLMPCKSSIACFWSAAGDGRMQKLSDLRKKHPEWNGGDTSPKRSIGLCFRSARSSHFPRSMKDSDCRFLMPSSGAFPCSQALEEAFQKSPEAMQSL